MTWLNLHAKVKAALATLGVIAVGETVAVVQGSLTWQDALKAFVVAAAPVVVAYIKPAPVLTEDKELATDA